MRKPMLLGTIQCRTPGLNCGNGLERVRGIEPPSRAWEALILPLNYTRSTAKPSTGPRVGTARYPRRSLTVSVPG
jgi:hypothetical protein